MRAQGISEILWPPKCREGTEARIRYLPCAEGPGGCGSCALVLCLQFCPPTPVPGLAVLSKDVGKQIHSKNCKSALGRQQITVCKNPRKTSQI